MMHDHTKKPPPRRTCGRVRYQTELGAKIALACIEREEDGECGWYFCKRCKGWHLTSVPAGASL